MPSEAFEQVVAMLRAGASSTPTTSTVKESRVAQDQLGAMFAVPDDVTVTPVDLAGVPCERFDPAGAADGGVLVIYFHGGAYVSGSLASHRSLTARIARSCECAALAVEYRLAPEHPYPAGLDDAVSVYRQTVSDGTAPGRIIVVGDSAGGGLVAALLVRLRDEGHALPAAAVLLSPWLDLTLTSDAITAIAPADPVLRRDALTRSASSYAGDDLRNPLVSPVFADLKGLPPVLVLVGTAEILLDDSRTFAERAWAAGVDIELDVEDGLIHVWPYIDGVPEADAAMQRIASWVQTRVAANKP